MRILATVNHDLVAIEATSISFDRDNDTITFYATSDHVFEIYIPSRSEAECYIRKAYMDGVLDLSEYSANIY